MSDIDRITSKPYVSTRRSLQELEIILIDEDSAAALEFLKRAVWERIELTNPMCKFNRSITQKTAQAIIRSADKIELQLNGSTAFATIEM